jgi:hypothetical protein
MAAEGDAVARDAAAEGEPEAVAEAVSGQADVAVAEGELVGGEAVGETADAERGMAVRRSAPQLEVVELPTDAPGQVRDAAGEIAARRQVATGKLPGGTP